MTAESTIERAKAEMASGRLWRAKEILSSSLSTYGCSRDISLAYANVLLEAGDELEAGRFYLLSVDEPDETQRCAIELFLTRFQKDDWRQLLSRFPSSARNGKRDDYPDFLRRHLVSLQAPELIVQVESNPATAKVWHSWLAPIGCLFVAIGGVICALVGAYTILTWLRGHP